MASAGASGILTVVDQRSYINIETLRGKNPTGIHSGLREVYGEKTVARITVCGAQTVARSTVCGAQRVARSTVCGAQTVDRSTVCGAQTVARSTVCGAQTVARSTVCGAQAVARSTVSRWAARFREELGTINDDPKIGRTKTSIDERSVKLVADFLAQNLRGTCEEMSQATVISPTSVFRILTKNLQKKEFVPDVSLTV